MCWDFAVPSFLTDDVMDLCLDPDVHSEGQGCGRL